MTDDPEKGWSVKYGEVRYKHNGYMIAFSDNRDLWYCNELDLDDKSLSKLKTKINKYDSEKRRVSNVPAWEMQNYSTTLTPVVITLIEDDKQVWVSRDKGHNRGRERSKESLSGLIPQTDEARKAILIWKDKVRIQQAAAAEEKAAREAIPRVTIDMLTGLKKASEDQD